MNSSVGGLPTKLAEGLALQTKPEFPIDEIGVTDATITFLCRNDKWPVMAPTKYTKVSDIPAADDGKTAAFLAPLDWLVVERSRFVRNGHTPGVGLLHVTCHGVAIWPEFSWGSPTIPNSEHTFGDPPGSDRITVPFTNITGTPTTGNIIYWQNTATSGDPTWMPRYIIEIKYFSLDYEARYAAETTGNNPRIIPAAGNVDDIADLPVFLRIVKSEVKAYIPFSIVDATGSPITSTDGPPGSPVTLPTDYEDWVIYNISVSNWTRSQAGALWITAETGRLQTIGKVPEGGSIIGYLAQQ